MKSPTLPQTTTGDWCISFGDTLSLATNSNDALMKVLDLIGKNQDGRVELVEDMGPRSWIGRFFGLSQRIYQNHLFIEWFEDIASLIFIDDADSEHRAKSTGDEKIKTEEKRRHIAHGELEPHPIDQCMPVTEATRAIDDYLKSMKRPDWIDYEYVA